MEKRTFLVNKFMESMISSNLRSYTIDGEKDSSLEELR
jgi:hypothetical protein